MKIAIAATLLITVLSAQEPSRSVWDGVYTQAQADRGQPLYNQHCASCHADTLMGGEMSPPLVGGEFLSNWNGLTLAELFERIRTSMPQNNPGKLSREVNADITAYILSVNKFPAGKTDLPHSAEFLRDIRIDPEKKQH
jgi:mono/diheme cytochrome c family protein